jgi:hypothetical protein
MASLSRTLPEWYDPRYSVCLVDGAGRPVCDLTVDEEYLGIRGWLKYHLRAFYATTKRPRDGAGSDFRPKLAVATRDLGDCVEVGDSPRPKRCVSLGPRQEHRSAPHAGNLSLGDLRHEVRYHLLLKPGRYRAEEQAHYEPARWVQRQADATGKPVALRASSMLMHLEAIRAGTGRGVLPCYVGDGHPLLERLTPPIPEIAAEYWIIVHRDLRRTACVRAVIDWMKALFTEQQDVLAGVV